MPDTDNLIYSIRELFGDFLQGRHFNIPEYQRGYKWTADNVATLLNDLRQFDPAENDFYCLQNITVAATDDGGLNVNDEHLYQILKQNEAPMNKAGYWVGKDHSGTDNWVLVTDDIVRVGIWYHQQTDESNQVLDQSYIVSLKKRGCRTADELKTALQCSVDEFEFLSTDGSRSKFCWDEKEGCYTMKVPFPKRNDFGTAAASVMKLIENIFESKASQNS